MTGHNLINNGEQNFVIKNHKNCDISCVSSFQKFSREPNEAQSESFLMVISIFLGAKPAQRNSGRKVGRMHQNFRKSVLSARIPQFGRPCRGPMHPDGCARVLNEIHMACRDGKVRIPSRKAILYVHDGAKLDQ